MKTPVYESSLLKASNEIAGPAIIEAATTTIKVGAEWNLKVDTIGSYLMWRKEAQLNRVLAGLSQRSPAAGSRRNKKAAGARRRAR